MALADHSIRPSPVNAQMQIVDATAGVVRATPRRPMVAIVGAGLTRRATPWLREDCEVWGLNVVPSCDRAGQFRADRWFEMHEMHAQSPSDWRWIQGCPVPLYVPPGAFARPGWIRDGTRERSSPLVVAYPLAAIEARFRKYWACTFGYQIALALHEGFTSIGLYGVDLAYGTLRERTVEWACVNYWVGCAAGMGVEVLIPGGSPIANHRYRYGIEYDAEKAAVEQYVDRMKAILRREDEADDPEDVGVGIGG